MHRSDYLAMADTAGAIAVAKLCINGRCVGEKSLVSDRVSLVRRSEAIATLIRSASHGPKQAHTFYDGGFFPICSFRRMLM